MCKATKLEVIEQAHELRQIKIRYSLVAADYQHVFIVLACRCVAKICGASDQQGVLSQRIDNHVFCMNIFNVRVQPAEVALSIRCAYHLNRSRLDRGLNAVPTPVTGSPSEIGKISSFQGRISRISGSFCNSSQYLR